MKALIYGQRWKKKDEPYIHTLISKLDKEGVTYAIGGSMVDEMPSELTAPIIRDKAAMEAFGPEVVITMGGDGTILSAVTMIKELEIPILGMNLGRLGFLASIEQQRIEEAIDLYLAGKYTLSERAMLELDATPNTFGKENHALNDFTIMKRDNNSMIVLHTYVDGVFLNSYWADGLIVSTPTGSTGYNLSCGGPIMFPTSDNFILTPVAPHNLNVRPVVLPSKHELSFKIEGRSENYLCTLDSRSTTVTADVELRIRKNKFITKLIQLDGENFMKTIRHKLNWGLDKRN